MNSALSLADQAKVDALAPAPTLPTAEAPKLPAHVADATQAAVDSAQAVTDDKAAKAKRAAKASTPAPTPAAAPAPKVKTKAPAAKKAKAAPANAPKAAKKAPVWGGAREGAGRKPLYKDAMTKAVTAKLTERQFKAFHRVPGGGTAWLRRGLDELIAAKRK